MISPRSWRLSIALAALVLGGVALAGAQDDTDPVFDDVDQAIKKSDRDIDKIKSEPPPDDVEAARERMKADVAQSRREQAEDFTRLSAQMEAQYRDYAKKVAEQRETYRKMVRRQWDEVRESSRKEWVDYSERGDAVSEVDFEKGKITVEVLVPVEEVTPKKKVEKASDLDGQEQEKAKTLAEEKIAERTKKVLTQKDEGKTEVLKDQVESPEGKPVTEKEAEAFVKEQVAPKMIVEEKPVVAEDGKPRLRVKVQIPMIPDHLKIRAQRYAPQVKSYAEKEGLDPALVFALIHTESYFNPLARSGAGALGLMQLVPKTAGMEAYRRLYKEEKLLTSEYLFDPDNNIKLGTAYLHILLSTHYGKLKNPDNRRSLGIAAYNCGPGNVRRTVLSRANPDAVSNEELLKVILKYAPQETQAYVPHVEGRIAMYRGL
ncbi:MAG: transglycosylase SLT domain-containing protein [Elusimicrobia bacterium]|nr:transglycosylase SLT domain-containing protein [Elusimicrobiota bacterium]